MRKRTHFYIFINILIYIFINFFKIPNTYMILFDHTLTTIKKTKLVQNNE